MWIVNTDRFSSCFALDWWLLSRSWQSMGLKILWFTAKESQNAERETKHRVRDFESKKSHPSYKRLFIATWMQFIQFLFAISFYQLKKKIKSIAENNGHKFSNVKWFINHTHSSSDLCVDKKKRHEKLIVIVIKCEEFMHFSVGQLGKFHC